MAVNARPNGLIIAIDGPSGAGKSTIARLLAKRLGYLQIDTGAMYRAVAFLVGQAGIDPGDVAAVERLCNSADIRLDNANCSLRVYANGQDVTELIRTPEMSLMTSRISALRPVRESMMLLQRRLGQDGGVVLEGRDIGTAVFPDAELKFFLFASPEERGKRRYAELVGNGEPVTLEETIEAVTRRDRQDSQRDIAPLRQAEDAIPVDSSHSSIEEVLNKMEDIARGKIQQAGTLL
ncbi:(d)CMP kinase [Oryzomonas japonica]|uniref:Cytidylate kinase n=1 Tax=Oryzomonas japonica TaxID=2603858 RepID=A0A7J4ZTA7_9BACT|nr:(d)CMP kinase [Oryzomonas japonica]KAB0666564.1 (d)CMP kinase [Oryzomonas japonica]